MFKKIKNLRDITAIIFIVIWFVMMIFVVMTLASCKPKNSVEHVTLTTVDSTWMKKPGQIHTLQFDPVYYARTKDSSVISGRHSFNVGDTIKKIKKFYTN